MKIILSRKGWDSGCGGRASPVFPDKTIQSLPIGCTPGSPLYGDIHPHAVGTQGHPDLADLIAPAAYPARYKVLPFAHLDPDLERGAYARDAGWTPCFGQENSSGAAAYLDNQGVGAGDLFLFYGWFDDVTRHPAGWRGSGNDRFLVWGWLQVGDIFHNPTEGNTPPWLHYHPHVIHGTSYKKNRIYVATRRLSVPGIPPSKFPGGGVFGVEANSRLISSTPGKRGRYPSRLPAGISLPSKHRQEHVIRAKDEDASRWVASLFEA